VACDCRYCRCRYFGGHAVSADQGQWHRSTYSSCAEQFFRGKASVRADPFKDFRWQGDPASGPAVIPDGKILAKFKIGGPSERDLAQQAINESLTPSRIDRAIEDYHEQTEIKPEAPVIIEHPIDDELQTGESRKLGGGMEIRSSWLK
jgi:hypothetical protein